MLPAVVPNARIMRYGYKSSWFGPDSIRHSAEIVAARLLIAARQERKVIGDIYPGKDCQTDMSRTASIDHYCLSHTA
jgi:hypothetical protein